jgi:Fe-S-cluster containining protein
MGSLNICSLTYLLIFLSVGTTKLYSHDNLYSCFNECRYHEISIYWIYILRVMIKIYLERLKVRRVVLDLPVLDQLDLKREGINFVYACNFLLSMEGHVIMMMRE